MQGCEVEEILYQDRHVTVTNKNVNIHFYYFPIATTKSIPIS